MNDGFWNALSAPTRAGFLEAIRWIDKYGERAELQAKAEEQELSDRGEDDQADERARLARSIKRLAENPDLQRYIRAKAAGETGEQRS